jgi:hypothetical protein
MKRSLLSFLLVVCFASTIVGPAAAAPPTIEDSASDVVLTEKYAWWTTRGVGDCNHCDAIYRTRLADGVVERIAKFPSSKISYIRAGGDTLVYRQVMLRGHRWLKSSVRTISESGQRRVLASATYRLRGKRRCGRQVAPLAISPTGEVAWSSFTVDKAKWGCVWLPDRVPWSARVSDHSASSRPLLRERRLLSALLTATEAATDGIGSMPGFTGRYGLLRSESGPLLLYDFKRGKRREVSNAGWDATLGPEGQLVTMPYLANDSSFIRLYPTAMSFAAPVELFPAEGSTLHDVKWCGRRLVAVYTDAEKKVRLNVHAADGSLVASDEVQATGENLLNQFACSATKALVRYSTDPEEGVFATRLLDLP